MKETLKMLKTDKKRRLMTAIAILNLVLFTAWGFWLAGLVTAKPCVTTILILGEKNDD